jgi:putative ATPase
MDTLFESEGADEPRTAADAGRPPHARAGGRPRGASAPEDRPLAVRVRPVRLEEFVGQTHLLAEGSALRTTIEQGHSPHSMILHGPPGSGKTTLARMVAEHSRAVFEELSAVQAGRAEVRGVLERAAHRHATSGTGTVFFLDEIHRFNKASRTRCCRRWRRAW